MNKLYKFKEGGMNEEELIFHSRLESTYPKNTIIETESYGLGKHLRAYGFYPFFLPILIHTDHGPNQWDHVTPHMLNSKADFFGFYSKRLVIDWYNKTKKKALLLQSPFVSYKHASRIQKSPTANGSIFFHAHSTFWTDKVTDYARIFQQFQHLPKEFHPISICMFFVDIQKERHKIYIENGFSVYTAGNWKHPFFTENFYEIVKNYKYALSNSVGSNIFYCINLGIPFSIIDGEPTLGSNIDLNILQSGKEISDHIQVQKNYTLFKGLNLTITDEQLELVNHELGIVEHTGRLKLSFVLYSALFIYMSRRFVAKLKSIFAAKFR